MFETICRIFIKDYKNIEDSSVRERYGTVFSIFSIVCNCVMVVFKFIVAFITNSVSISADALNNLSDVGSNIATLFGFKLANKHADADHPYGHGRMEYVSGMIVSFLILLMGFEAIKDAVSKIINPETLVYSNVAVIVLVISICIKLFMSYINNHAGKLIKSETLIAAGQDSKNDAIMTSATLIALLIFKFTGFNLDAYIGLVVSIFVIKSGIEIFKGVLDTILGKAPDKELINKIEKTIMSHKEIHGIHDLMLHDYGLSQQFMTLHAEVDADANIIDTHDLIDRIEEEILEKYHILTTIHMDPIDYKDKEVRKVNTKVKSIVKSINPEYTIHDFRMVKGPTHTNLVFDLLLPAGDKSSHEEVSKKVQEAISNYNKDYKCVIKVEHSFVG